ncbi:autotransporter outer membrane beta-barrel domain-containing protein [Pseudomonas sp. NPDC096950]|uniref:autotransporter outer membrane beta-barrel domain-containing protein n=1 Tax=Pseudomonas sp. NPDC096950 TaxID=3364485 RepID=UPI00383BED98
MQLTKDTKWRYPSFAVLFLVLPQAQARFLNPGETESISPSPAVESWQISPDATLTVNGAQTLDITIEGGTLNVNGGQTRQIEAANGGTVNLDGATVTGTDGFTTLTLANSNANISNSTVSGLQFGLQAVRFTSTETGSQVTLLDSTVQGTSGGAVVTAFSTLNLSNTTIEGTGASSFGLGLLGGQANASAGSKIIGGLNGVTFQPDGDNEQVSKLVLDNSSVEGKTGSAIIADLENNPLGSLIIEARNGSTLKGGNGTILEVAGGAAVNFTVDNSSLQGNVDVESGSPTNVLLRNNASLTGDLLNVADLRLDNQSAFNGNFNGDPAGSARVVLDNGSVFTGGVENVTDFAINHSTWVMTGSNTVNNLTLAGGTVDLAPGPTFYKLDVVNLSGNGTFSMATDFGSRQTDFLNVTGTATGTHELLVSATGSKPADDQPIQVVKVASGDARFSLRNAVDAGAFTYKLFEDDNGWFLRPDAQVSTSTQSVLAIANTAPTIIYAENTLLNTRMGDRRLTGAKPGLWTRTYGNRYSVENAYGDGYSQTQQGLVIGADTALGDSDWLVGGMVGYSKTSLDLKRGSSGTVDSYSVGAYATKFDAQSGFYVDAVTKINRFDNDLKVSMSDGVRTRGGYDNYGLSGSLEIGKQSEFGNGFFWAPFAQVSAAVVSGDHYTLDNGLDVDSELTRSLVAKGGLYAGREIDLGNGQKLQPRLRVAVGHEFIKNNEVSVNDSNFNNDSSTTSVEWAGGVNWALPRGVQLFVEGGSSRSKTVNQDYNVSAGFSVNF